MPAHTVVSPKEWLAARQELLRQEKALTRQRDEVARLRRQMPWVQVDKRYVFEGPAGPETLADLFAGRSQLLVHHFMFGPDWTEGCPGCSLMADHVDGALPHLAARDVTFVAVSRAPLDKLDAFKRRMGWRFKWVSSLGGDFNFDFGVSFTDADKVDGRVLYNYTRQEFPATEAPGVSVFFRDEAGDVFHTYSSFARGCEQFIGAYNFLDLVPKGRDEQDLEATMKWVRHHDKYPVDIFAEAARTTRAAHATSPAPSASAAGAAPCPACAKHAEGARG